MSGDGLLQVSQDRPMLQPERLDHRQHPFRESASRLAVATERVLPPEHPTAEDPLGMIVRRLDPLAPREQPQRQGNGTGTGERNGTQLVRTVRSEPGRRLSFRPSRAAGRLRHGCGPERAATVRSVPSPVGRAGTEAQATFARPAGQNSAGH